MLFLLALHAAAAEPAAEPTPAPPVPAAAPVTPPVTEGPGRPVVGIGAGLRGATGAAGFVTSVRVRVTPWLVADPMVYVLTSKELTTTTTTFGEKSDAVQTEELLGSESVAYAALALRFRVAEGRRASGWVLVTGNVLVQDLESVSTFHVTGEEEPTEPEEETTAQSSGGAGVGFSGELWLRPELTLSADAGFNLWETARAQQTRGDTETVYTSSGFKVSPFVQLALHLYL